MRSPVSDTRCRRCLLRELAEGQELYESVKAYRAELPEDVRTTDAAFEARLERCRSCPYLNNATCMQCGCFVEIRAAKRDIHCPMGSW